MEQRGFCNTLKLRGTLKSPLQLSHRIYGEEFYTAFLSVPRLSGQRDVLPVTMGARLLCGGLPGMGDALTVMGQLRSYNMRTAEKSRLVLTAFCKDVILQDTGEGPTNYVNLTGCLVKPPVYRHTPLNREITDILLAVNRPFYKSDYIPCIAWGRLARELSTSTVGEKLSIIGRFQSREYEKRQADGTCVMKTAYEVSVMSLENH